MPGTSELIDFRRAFVWLLCGMLLPSVALIAFGVVAVVNERVAVERRLETDYGARLRTLDADVRARLQLAAGAAATEALARSDVALPALTSRTRVHAHMVGAREGALVVRLTGEARIDVLPFLEEFALGFEAIVERDRIARASASNGDRLQQTYERRLKRAAFDLHDGPLQDLAALAGEVRQLRSQIDGAEMPAEVMGGRLDDVSGRIGELDRVLRGVMHSLETSTLTEAAVDESLEREAETFRRRTNAEIDLSVSGPVDDLTMSQRIA
ncbi:MAG: hypothetical protein ACJ79H_11910, partial [Myxococcales bacterium]